MTFQILIRSIEKYLHIQGADNKELIKDFINESILDFIRLADWEKLKKVYQLALTDASPYDLTLITEKFYSEISLINEAGDKFIKLDYENYLRATDKSGYYSLVGTDLYVSGDNANVDLVYLATGTQYPLTADGDEIPSTKYYPDIIKKMVVVMMLDYIGDETVEKEEQNLAKKLVTLKKSENRTRQHGKMPYVNRT